MKSSGGGDLPGFTRRFRRRRGASAAVIYLFALVVVTLLRSMIANALPVVASSGTSISFPAFSGQTRPSYPWRFSIPAPIPFSPTDVHLGERLQPPGESHWLGTDELGRDVLARMIHGSAVSLAVGFISALLALFVGSAIGGLAGYYGGGVDWTISRVIEIVVCFPFLFIVLAVVSIFEPSLITIIGALGLSSWPMEARLVRGEMLRLRDMDFAESARASGATSSRVLVRHLLPNALAPVLALVAFGVGSAILAESALSFLGLGVALPTPSWGGLLASAEDYLGHAWWLALFPGLAIFATVVACNVVGDALREALDPKSA
ncbi:MAG: ABC transporter permease [Acidobacteriota bacterium]